MVIFHGYVNVYQRVAGAQKMAGGSLRWGALRVAPHDTCAIRLQQKPSRNSPENSWLHSWKETKSRQRSIEIHRDPERSQWNPGDEYMYYYDILCNDEWLVVWGGASCFTEAFFSGEQSYWKGGFAIVLGRLRAPSGITTFFHCLVVWNMFYFPYQ